eukprot:6030335-Prymnesium_polylepis.2
MCAVSARRTGRSRPRAKTPRPRRPSSASSPPAGWRTSGPSRRAGRAPSTRPTRPPTARGRTRSLPIGGRASSTSSQTRRREAWS